MALFGITVNFITQKLKILNTYRTRAIKTRSRFETALDYKPRIFKVRKVSWYYKPLCSINRGLYTIKNWKILILIVAEKVFFLFDL